MKTKKSSNNSLQIKFKSGFQKLILDGQMSHSLCFLTVLTVKLRSVKDETSIRPESVTI
jgi:hypothetical protein